MASRRRAHRLLGLLVAALLGLAGLLDAARVDASDIPANVILHAIPREILFFSALSGQWTAVRLDAGERILQASADGNVAAVLTSLRVLGFSGPLTELHEVRVPEEETREAFRVEGNVATLLTRRRALGFSAMTGRWNEIDRFNLGR